MSEMSSFGNYRAIFVCRRLIETSSDFQGAVAAGMQGLLLRRTGPDGEQAHKEPGEFLDGVEVIKDLEAVVSFVEARNST